VVEVSAEENMQLMKALDDAWNSRDWETFKKRHAENVTVYWPAQAEPTRGREPHHLESVEFCTTFPDNRVKNDPYDIIFGQDDWTCMVTRFSGTMTGPMKRPDGETIPPTNKGFDVEFCTVAHWQNGEIVVEKLFFDFVGMMRQLGLM
jgi:SnoaL-like polyketide cyclase